MKAISMAKHWHSISRTSLLSLTALIFASCSQGSNESENSVKVPAKGVDSPYLFLFAGDDDERHSDFFLTIDMAPNSATKGQPISTTPIGYKGSMPHHMEYTAPPSDEPIFMNGHHDEVSLVVDVSDPRAMSVKTTFQPPEKLRYPHDYERTENGTRLVGFLRSEGPSPDPNETIEPGGHGGIAEYTIDGTFIRSTSASVAGMDKPVRPYAFALLPKEDRFLVTSAPMHETSWADVVQVYRYSDFSLLHTIDLPVGKLSDGTVLDGSQRAGFGPRVLDDGSIFLNSYGCAFYHVTEIETEEPKVSMVHALKTKATSKPNHIRGACGIPVRVGNFWIQPVGKLNAVVVLDISDPTNPKEVFRLKTPGGFRPHWLAKDPSSNRFVLGAEFGGEQGVFILRFDETNGNLGFDDTLTGEMAGWLYNTEYAGYISLHRKVWPHGETGPAWAHSALFLKKGN